MKGTGSARYKVIEEESYESKQRHELEKKGKSSSKHVGCIRDRKKMAHVATRTRWWKRLIALID